MIRALGGALLLGFCTLAQGAIGTIDPAPGATLFFPHFEVDTQNDQGNNTFITIQNTSATAILGNVVLWTDYGLPTHQFNVYLTGYDQETLNLRNLFVQRFDARTASAGQDPGNGISPQGPFSQDINFASCGPFLPDGQSGRLGPELIAAHTGGSAPQYFGSNLCGSRNYGDGIARGYITIDAVNSCGSDGPGDFGYFFSGGAGRATNQNVMVGEYVIFDANNRRMLAEPAVGIEASGISPLTTGGALTFYGEPGSADNREPLPTAWAGRFSQGRTSIDYWRAPRTTSDGRIQPFTCGSAPTGAATDQRLVSVFDATGTLTGQPTGNLFAGAAGTVSGNSLGLNAGLGWVFVNLNLGDDSIRQSWLNFRQVPADASTGAPYGYSTGGIQLGNPALGPANPILP
ncbi:MAG: hypothetical protein IPK97_08760 [Ahniella sp.]|nr:hypothetical protein [Ahniella sp.]